MLNADMMYAYIYELDNTLVYLQTKYIGSVKGIYQYNILYTKYSVFIDYVIKIVGLGITYQMSFSDQ